MGFIGCEGKNFLASGVPWTREFPHSHPKTPREKKIPLISPRAEFPGLPKAGETEINLSQNTKFQYFYPCFPLMMLLSRSRGGKAWILGISKIQEQPTRGGGKGRFSQRNGEDLDGKSKSQRSLGKRERLGKGREGTSVPPSRPPWLRENSREFWMDF